VVYIRGYSQPSTKRKGVYRLDKKRESPIRVTVMTKFVVAQAAAEMGISKQQVMEDVLCAAFPAHTNNYKVLNKEK